jgi:hypothetical protein
MRTLLTLAAAGIMLAMVHAPAAAGPASAFEHEFEAIEGGKMPLGVWRGKALLVVNTASFCGYTPQYEGLQKLWERYEPKGLVVIGVPSNDFGEQVLIRAAGRGIDDQWQRWSIFTLSTNAQEADTRLFVPPALTQSLDGEPVEKVHFLRDEMANMAWAVERVVPTTLGTGISGYAAARIAAGPPPPPVPRHPTPAKVQYVLGTDVPENWFPFVPVHMAGSTRSVELQRARMPGENRPIRGAVLNPGPKAYFINEEEVPRAGRLVTRSYQRTRWFDGSTYVWLGRRSGTGRGEGSSNLQFDQVDPVKVATP